MAFALDLRTHQHWEDWLGFGLGLLIIVSPWMLLPADALNSSMQIFIFNTVIAGLLIACLSVLEIQVLEPWEEWTIMVLGLWIAASPWIFGYSAHSALTLGHVVLGLLVAALACVERWQDTHRRPAAPK